MSVKKAFLPLVALLTAAAEQNKKVKDILADVTELCSAKGAGGSATTFERDENGVVAFVHDYYFGKWLPTSHVDFGSKAGSPSGLNSMCKEGVSNWTRQQREFRAAKEALLAQVADGTVPADQIQAKLAEFEAARAQVKPFSIPALAFDTLEQAKAATKKQLDKAVADYNAEQVKLAEAQAAAPAV